MAPDYNQVATSSVRVFKRSVGELAAADWANHGVMWSDIADAKSGTRTTIYQTGGDVLVIEPRGK